MRLLYNRLSQPRTDRSRSVHGGEWRRHYFRSTHQQRAASYRWFITAASGDAGARLLIHGQFFDQSSRASTAHDGRARDDSDNIANTVCGLYTVEQQKTRRISSDSH